MLDIHQISTGRGNAGLYIFPDGTTLLVDAGELPTKTAAAHSRPPGRHAPGRRVDRALHPPRPGA